MHGICGWVVDNHPEEMYILFKHKLLQEFTVANLLLLSEDVRKSLNPTTDQSTPDYFKTKRKYNLKSKLVLVYSSVVSILYLVKVCSIFVKKRGDTFKRAQLAVLYQVSRCAAVLCAIDQSSICLLILWNVRQVYVVTCIVFIREIRRAFLVLRSRKISKVLPFKRINDEQRTAGKLLNLIP